MSGVFNVFSCANGVAAISELIHIRKQKQVTYSEITGNIINIKDIKDNFGNKVCIDFLYNGEVEIRIGLDRAPFFSYQWIYEAKVANKKNEINEFKYIFDITDFENGNLEIFFLGIRDTCIYERIITACSSMPDVNSVLYDFSFPSYDLCTEEPLYFRDIKRNAIDKRQKVYYSYEKNHICILSGGKLDLLTYFNSFSGMKWKKYTNVNKIKSYIEVQGKAKISVVGKYSQSIITLASYFVNTKEKNTFVFDIGEYSNNAILGLRVQAEEDTKIFDGGWASDDATVRNIKLGIGITTFKREKDVVLSVKRLNNAICRNEKLSKSIKITVIDNGKTLKEEDVSPATLIPNKNTGGTGGFIKSLLYYASMKEYTYCLFMDDDAHCEMSSIYRSLTFLEHAKDNRLSISGAMLFDSIKFLQWENGAYFDSGCHSYNRDFDLRDINILYKNEDGSNKGIYGAWWFFMFPIKQAKNMPFPFFVRGDDIDFSYVNDFNIITLNGVSCWQQDFKTKENPLSIYLFIRSHLIHYMTIERLAGGFSNILKIVKTHFKNYNNSYMYKSAACVNLAIEHVLKGPEFFETHITPIDVFKHIKEMSKYEKEVKIESCDLEKFEHIDKNRKTKILPKFIRSHSFYGHILPAVLFEHKTKEFLYKWELPRPNRVFLREKIYVINNELDKGVVLSIDRREYFRNVFRFIKNIIKLRVNYKRIKSIYSKNINKYRNEEFWKSL